MQALQQLILREGVEEAVVAALDLGPLPLVLAGTRLPVGAAPVIRGRQQGVHSRDHFWNHLSMQTHEHQNHTVGLKKGDHTAFLADNKPPEHH